MLLSFFFSFTDDDVSFFLHLMHHHSCLYTSCLTRLAHHKPSHIFKSHGRTKHSTSLVTDEEFVPLNHFLDYADREPRPVYPTVRCYLLISFLFVSHMEVRSLISSIEYRHSLRGLPEDNEPFVFIGL